jgi:hypothetical protein
MRLLGGALVAGGLLTLCYLGILHGWRAWQRRRGRLAAPPPPPPRDLDTSEAIVGVYVATTTAYDWTDRIAVHGLGVRSRAAVAIGADGVAVLRSAAPSFYIPADELLAVRTARGIAGKVGMEAAGLVVFTWQHDGHRLDTGFRPRHAADVQRLVDLGGDLATTSYDEELDEDTALDEPVVSRPARPWRPPPVLPSIEYQDDDLDLDLEPDLDPDLDPELGSEPRRRHYANGDTR